MKWKRADNWLVSFITQRVNENVNFLQNNSTNCWDSFGIRQLKSIVATILFITGYIYSCFMLFSFSTFILTHHNSIFIVYLPTIFAKRFYNEALWLDLCITLCTVSGPSIITYNTIKCEFFFFIHITKLTQCVSL
jgi:hypothetical protein